MIRDRWPATPVRTSTAPAAPLRRDALAIARAITGGTDE